MSNLYNVSSSPHVRSKLTTGNVMLDVILALIPTTAVGIYTHGVNAAIIIALSIVSAVATEWIFCKLSKKPSTVGDLSAVLTGLLLALCLPEGVPYFIPVLGSVFAIFVVKCLFGGLGKNIMNPALTARCFLLISFGTMMTTYKLDGVATATPLVDLANGAGVNLGAIIFGTSNGVIGSSALGILVGGLYLWIVGGITFEIPAASIAVFTVFIALFGGHGFDPVYLLTHICTGGILLGAFFMATDPVTSPVTSNGQLIYGACVGLLAAIFRVYGSAADSVSYAIIISNMFTPLIDEHVIPVPFGHKNQDGRERKEGIQIPKSAITLCVITLIAGLALGGVFAMTKDIIAEQQEAAKRASYVEVCEGAETFEECAPMTAAKEELDGGIYGTDFGKAYINDAVKGIDASGNTVGYVINVTTGDGFDGDITMSVGIDTEGTITGVSFTEITETAGMGMRCAEDAFKGQFVGRNVDKFTLNKAGGSTTDEEIDSVSGASISSGAVVNAVNAAKDFCAAYAE